MSLNTSSYLARFGMSVMILHVKISIRAQVHTQLMLEVAVLRGKKMALSWRHREKGTDD